VALVVPTALSYDLEDFNSRLRRVRPFASRIHVDVTDGVFSEARTIGLDQVHGIDGIPFDLHLMFRRPQDQLARIIALRPKLAIIHAEADCDHAALAAAFRANGLKAGLALLPETAVSSVRDLLPSFDHVLIFTGTLGENGGEFKSECLPKIAAVKTIKPTLEVSVDGGVTLRNAADAVRAGADILYVGGAIQHAPSPQLAYEELSRIAKNA
jgi:ribulose-phosphate 3-epimerase